MRTLRTATALRAAPVLAAAVVVLLGSGSAPAADAPDLGSGGFVMYVGLWVTESFASKLAMYDPASESWREWRMPGVGTGDRTGHPYAVCVDSEDKVWVTDFSTNTLQRFDPLPETFEAIRIPTKDALVRQIVEVDGTIWGGESATEKLIAFTPAA